MEGAILSHLSGSTTKGDVHLTFHWVVPDTDKNDSSIYDVMQYEEEEHDCIGAYEEDEDDYYVPPEYVDPSELASAEDDYYVP